MGDRSMIPRHVIIPLKAEEAFQLRYGETKNSKIRGFEFAQFALSLVITNQISIIIFLPAVLKLNLSGYRGCFLSICE